MNTPKDIEEFTKIDRQAKLLADKEGACPDNHIVHTILLSTAVYVLLRVFAGVTLPNDEAAAWPVVIFTALCGGGFFAIQWLRERAWRTRYHKALDTLNAAAEDAGCRAERLEEVLNQAQVKLRR